MWRTPSAAAVVAAADDAMNMAMMSVRFMVASPIEDQAGASAEARVNGRTSLPGDADRGLDPGQCAPSDVGREAHAEIAVAWLIGDTDGDADGQTPIGASLEPQIGEEAELLHALH